MCAHMVKQTTINIHRSAHPHSVHPQQTELRHTLVYRWEKSYTHEVTFQTPRHSHTHLPAKVKAHSCKTYSEAKDTHTWCTQKQRQTHTAHMNTHTHTDNARSELCRELTSQGSATRNYLGSAAFQHSYWQKPVSHPFKLKAEERTDAPHCVDLFTPLFVK